MSKKRNEYFLNNVVETLNDKGIVILPLDVGYVLCVKYGDEVSLEKLHKIKGRLNDLTLVVNSYKMLEKFVYIDKYLLKKLKSVYPGLLTLICKKKENVIFSKDKIMVRMINNELVNSIIDKLGVPLVITRACTLDSKIITNFDDLLESFNDEVDLIIMGGKLKKEETTVIDVSDSNDVTLVKEGKMKFVDILEMLKS